MVEVKVDSQVKEQGLASPQYGLPTGVCLYWAPVTQLICTSLLTPITWKMYLLILQRLQEYFKYSRTDRMLVS